jgi:uncharacterized protein YndB with AHSA1/START domain
MQIESNRHRPFDVSPEELWAALAEVDRYRSWWPWLQRLDADALALGETWSCAVRAPLGYPVRFELDLDRVEPPRSISARVTGDVVGVASIDLERTGGGSVLNFRSALEPAAGHLRLLGRVAPGIARRGHDAVIDGALHQFGERAF